MISTKRFCLSVVLFLASGITSIKASEIVNTPIELPESPCSFAGDFKQAKTVAGLNQSLESSGSFYFHCEEGVIWSTKAPVTETLIFSKSGDNFQIKENVVSKLKTRQAKLLGKLLNSMMSSDQSDIEKKFTLTELESEQKGTQFLLLPKKKSLKRAIKEINLRFSSVSNVNIDENVTENRQTTIEIRDRKNQITSIESTQTHEFALTHDNQKPHSDCANSPVPLNSCDVLYPPVTAQ